MPTRIEILKQLENGLISSEEALKQLAQIPMDGVVENTEPEKSTAAVPPPKSNTKNPIPVMPQVQSFDSPQGNGSRTTRESIHTEGAAASHAQSTQHGANHEQTNFVNGFMGGVQEVTGWLGDVVNDITDAFNDYDVLGNASDLLSGTFGSFKNTLAFKSSPIAQGLDTLILIGKNAKVQIYGYDGNTVNLECTYTARRADAQVILHEENGCIQLMYDEKMMRNMAIVAQIPNHVIKHVQLASKNDALIVENVAANKIELFTKNDSLKASAIKCDELIIQNRNDVIKLKIIQANTIIVQTSNDTISAEDIRATNARFITSNARVKTNNLDVVNLQIKTSNTGVKLDKTLMHNIDHFEGERYVQVQTTNGGVSFTAPIWMDVKLAAQTSGGRISCDRSDMYFTEQSKTHTIGQTAGYDISGKKYVVQLFTTNSNIKIKQ